MTAENEAPTVSMSLGSKLLAALVNPKKLYTHIATQSARGWIIFALISLALFTLPIIVGGPIQQQQALAEFEEVRGELELPEGQPDPAQFIANPFITIVLPATFGAFGVALGWLIWGGALHLISSLTGGRNTFLQMLRLVIWSWVPFGVRAIVQTIYIGVTQTLVENPGLSGFIETGITPDNPFAQVSAGTLALQAFLQQIEIYLFWRLALLVLGVGIIAKLPRRKALAAVFVVWVVFALIRVGAAAAAGGIGSTFAG